MRARNASFVISASEPRGFPPPTLSEIAFAGRSNVGKSSLINTLVGVPKLARTSSTPGRTRLLNWFKVAPPSGPDLHFVDLPGFGYAKVSKDLRQAWRPLIEAFLRDREAVKLVVLLVDMRRGPEREEEELALWLEELGIPFVVVLTKADKLSKSQRFPAVAAARRQMRLPRDPIAFSAESGDGIDPLWRAILGSV